MNAARFALPLASLPVVVLGVVACGAAPVVTRPAPTASAPDVTPSRAVEPQPEFIASHRARARGIPLGDHVGILHAGTRFEIDAAGRIVGRADGALDLGEAYAIPADAGGGVLFAGESLFRAPTFLGLLTRVSNPNSRAQSVSFGPAQALVVLDAGPVVALSLPDFREVAPFPAGATIAARSKSGLGGVIVEGGHELSTADGGKTWSRVVGPPLPDPSQVRLNSVLGVEGRDDGVYFFELARTLRVDASGVTEVHAGQENPEKTLQDGMFDDVIANGAVLEMDLEGTPTKAIAGLVGTIYVADLATGAVEQMERGVLPAQMDCRTTRLAQEIVVACAKGENAAVFSGPIGGKITIEHTFNTTGTFVRGGGDALVFTSACAGLKSELGVACHRAPRDGATPAKWTPLDRHAELTDVPLQNLPRVLAWVPTPDGAKLLLGGPDPGVMDVGSGARTHLEPEAGATLELLFEKAARPVLDERFVVEHDGSIRGVDDRGRGVHITDGGAAVELSPFTYASSAHAGRFVLAAQSSRALYLSSDWGRTFVEVAGAPSAAPVQQCSEVGCRLGPWLRLGWAVTPPKPGTATPVEPIGSSAAAPSPPNPTFVCKSAGVITRTEVPVDYASLPNLGASATRVGNDESTYIATFPRRFIGPSGSTDTNTLRALTRGVIPYVDGVLVTDNIPAKFDRQVTWLEPFDPKATLQKAKLDLNALVSRASASGIGAIDVTASSDDGQALAIASEVGGLYLSVPTAPPLWARLGKITPIAPPGGLSPVSVVETKPDELTVLTSSADGAVVFRLSPTSAQPLFSVPPPLFNASHIDSLAVDAGGGLGVVRLPGGDPPTAVRPALLLRDGAPPIALAPWSTLAASDAPGCSKGEGYRTVLVLPTAWVGFDLMGDASGPSTMRVRWSEDRVCLEGAEIPGPLVSMPSASLESYLAIRMGKDAGAAQLAYAPGSEFREPRTCVLTGPAIERERR